MLDHHINHTPRRAPSPVSTGPAPQPQASPSAPPFRPSGPQPHGTKQSYGKKR
ncbi:hypothetical protein GCM10010495_05000 [Kitasatospora herbaricolor]|nr:hypothetical protein GCM10010495_05000 [Kitasatospora herbaricolor]